MLGVTKRRTEALRMTAALRRTAALKREVARWKALARTGALHLGGLAVVAWFRRNTDGNLIGLSIEALAAALGTALQSCLVALKKAGLPDAAFLPVKSSQGRE